MSSPHCINLNKLIINFIGVLGFWVLDEVLFLVEKLRELHVVLDAAEDALAVCRGDANYLKDHGF